MFQRGQSVYYNNMDTLTVWQFILDSFMSPHLFIQRLIGEYN